MSNNKKLRVLVVDDESYISGILTRLVEKLDCEILCVMDGHEVGQALMAFSPDVIFLDLVLPGFDGVEIVHLLAEMEYQGRIVLMSGLNRRIISSVREVAEKNQLSVLDAISKPFKPGQIEGLLQPIIDARDSQQVFSGEKKRELLGSGFGPQLVYEPQYRIHPDESETPICFRLELIWKTDGNQAVPFSDMIDAFKAEDIAKGQFEFLLIMLASDLMRAGMMEKDFAIKIPLSYSLLTDKKAPAILEQAITRSGLDKKNIFIEVRAESLLANTEAAMDVMSHLEIKGMNVSLIVGSEIDQVLAMLEKLPIEEVVVNMADKTLRSNVINNAEAEYQVGSLVSMATKAGMNTAVLNLVTPEQKEFAARCKIGRASGTLLGKKTNIFGAVNLFKN